MHTHSQGKGTCSTSSHSSCVMLSGCSQSSSALLTIGNHWPHNQTPGENIRSGWMGRSPVQDDTSHQLALQHQCWPNHTCAKHSKSLFMRPLRRIGVSSVYSRGFLPVLSLLTKFPYYGNILVCCRQEPWNHNMEMEENAASESTGDMHCFIGSKQKYIGPDVSDASFI